MCTDHPYLPPIPLYPQGSLGMQARQAAALLETDLGQAPGDSAQADKRKAAVPPAERIWALRNVAQTLALGGRKSWPQARDMLQEAVQLKQRLVGSTQHPGGRPDLPLAGAVPAAGRGPGRGGLIGQSMRERGRSPPAAQDGCCSASC